MSDAVQQRMGILQERSKAAKEKHAADVRYVEERYPELAAFLTDMTREFGRIDYRAVLKK